MKRPLIFFIFSSSSEEEETIAATFLMSIADGKRKRKHKFWVHDTIKKRNTLGEFHTLLQELEDDDEKFKEYFRMSKEKFDNPLEMIQVCISLNGTPIISCEAIDIYEKKFHLFK